jgi:hypothetical protein
VKEDGRRRRIFVVILMCVLFTGPAPATAQDVLDPALRSADDDEGADILGTFTDSLRLLLIEHAFRISFQGKTRRELGGNFWTDYSRSVRVPGQWEDTDAWGVNYIGHPIHGAAAGYIWLDHEPGAPTELSLSRKYWTSRGRATAWSAAYSLQFEIGPLSEASIGNVGMRPATTGWVDHVITPVGAFGWMVAEDALDRYLVKWVEGRVQNRVVRGLLRVLLNPSRALSNSSTGRLPWHRDGRPVSGG